MKVESMVEMKAAEMVGQWEFWWVVDLVDSMEFLMGLLWVVLMVWL